MTIENAISLHRNEWIVYAKETLMLSAEEIAEKVNLAVSTIWNYVRKYSYLLESAREIFDRLYFKPKKRKADEVIQTNCNMDLTGEQCYLFRFYDKENNLVCSKVGTTKRKVKQRLMEELRTKTYSDCDYAVVDRVYNCGEMPAEGLESRIRAEYIKKYPQAFKKNDRFIKTEFDLELVDKIVEEYLA